MRVQLSDKYHFERCPFCGNDDNFSILEGDYGTSQVECADCNARGPEEVDDYHGLIIQAWNERG